MIERVALGRIHPAILWRIGRGSPLLGRKVAELAEGPGHGVALVRRQRAKLLHGAAHLGPLIDREVLHNLGVCEQALPLLRRHRVELGKAVAHLLLRLLRKLLEPWLALERTLLLIGREVAMQIHPLREVLASGPMKLGIAPLDGGGPTTFRLSSLLPLLRLLCLLVLLRRPALDWGRRVLANLRRELAVTPCSARVSTPKLRMQRCGPGGETQACQESRGKTAD